MIDLLSPKGTLDGLTLTRDLMSISQRILRLTQQVNHFDFLASLSNPDTDVSPEYAQLSVSKLRDLVGESSSAVHDGVEEIEDGTLNLSQCVVGRHVVANAVEIFADVQQSQLGIWTGYKFKPVTEISGVITGIYNDYTDHPILEELPLTAPYINLSIDKTMFRRGKRTGRVHPIYIIDREESPRPSLAVSLYMPSSRSHLLPAAASTTASTTARETST